MSGTRDWVLPDAEATTRLGAAIAPRLAPGETVLLYGPLGMGKSTLARGLIRAMTTPEEDVPSPTFTLVQFYESAPPVAHFDLYRLTRPEEAVGMEARVAIYVGWPVREGDIAPPAVVERNQLVTLQFRRFGLEIETEGRALGRAGVGEKVRVMNLDSRAIVTGSVVAAGVVEVR